MSDRLRRAAARGAADARALLGEPGAVGRLPLGDFGAGGTVEATARRMLHALRVPPALLDGAARLGGDGWAARLGPASERYAYWHGARRSLDRETWRRLTLGTAILMYHAIGVRGEAASRFIVPEQRLRRQLRSLARGRRPVLGLAELADHLQAGRLPPAGAVAITLDDGFADNAMLAAPLLRRFGFPATVFVVSDRVGASADWDGAGELAGRPLLDWPGIEELAAGGLEVGAHSRTHPRLPELAPEEAADEIVGSRDAVSARLGLPVRSFCYPYGRTSSGVVRTVAGAGFACACGVDRGLNYPGTPLHELRRVPVDGDASMLRFALGVRFGDPDVLARVAGRIRDGLLARARRGAPRPQVDRP